MGEKEPDWSG